MNLPIPLSPLVGSAAHVLRPHHLQAGLHRGAAPLHYPQRTVEAVSTSSIVFTLIGIAVWAGLLGLAALSTARYRAGSAHTRPTLRALPSGHDQPHRHPVARVA